MWAVTQVAERLGNTVAVCRKCYIHPAVLQGYADGSLLTRRAQYEKQRDKNVVADTLARAAENGRVSIFLPS